MHTHDGQVTLSETINKPMQQAGKSTGAKRWTRLTAHAAGTAWVVLALAATGVHAQNAAQSAALARLFKASPNVYLPSGLESTTIGLSLPTGLTFDSAGNIYIADTGDNLVREVNLAGIISTVAGNGAQGFAGDGGTATDAQLDSPAGVAVDSSGNIYIADTNNNRIREVSGGIINTIAGTGSVGYSGDGGAATSATLAGPTAVALDAAGNVYIADTDNFCIRKITGATISTVAGNGMEAYSGDGGLATAASLDLPQGVAVDSAGNIYIADTNNQRVRKVAATTGIITTIAGTGVSAFNSDGAATSAALASPRGIAVDPSGNIYVADSGNDRIRVISSGSITTIAGVGVQGFSGDTGSSTSAALDSPYAVAVNGNQVMFSDTNNNRVRSVTSSTVNTVAGLAPATAESLVIGTAFTGVYGTGTLTATFANNGQTGTGMVTFYDGQGASPAVIGTAALSGNAASVSTGTLAAGTHSIIATYSGDTNNPAIASGVYVYIVTPAPLSAVANAVNLLYGQTIPALTGTLTGVVPQDTSKVSAVYSTTATITSDPGAYPIAVKLAGAAAANYTVSLGAGSGSVIIAKAPTTVTLHASNNFPILGTPVTLTAVVASTTSGTPTGTLNFYNGATLLNATPLTLVNGSASLTISTLPLGAQSITAVYNGSVDFIVNTSSALTPTVLSPEFTLTASPASQTILPGQSAAYTATFTPVNATFLYPVTYSVSGLPNGVTAIFNPTSIATGAGTTKATMTVSASTLAELHKGSPPLGGLPASSALAFLLLPFVFSKRTRRAATRLSRSGKLLLALLALAAAAGAVTGCGGGGFFGHTTNNYTVTVTAVSGPVTHTANVTLTVQ